MSRSGRSAPGALPTSEQIAEVHGHIRRCLTARLGVEGKTVRILYGARRSIRPNASEILVLPDVGGALVGGSSLKAADFEAILRTDRVSPHRA
jgi:triosephosphate isomerase (TIM)